MTEGKAISGPATETGSNSAARAAVADRSLHGTARDVLDRIGTEAEFQKVIDELQSAIRDSNRTAIVVFVVAILAAIPAMIYLPLLTVRGAQNIALHPHNVQLALYELLRGTAFAGIVASVLLGILHLGRAALDQKTRFQKRLMAAHFIHHVLSKYSDQISNGQMELKDVIDSIAAWSTTVESAYTNVKFGSKRGQDLKIVFDKEGHFVAEQGNPGK